MNTDDEIQKNINAELQFDPRLNGSEISTVVKDREVILTGTTDSYPQLSYAEKAVRRVHGVVAVKNDLKVNIPLSMKKSDEKIKQDVENVIKWNSAIAENENKIKVFVKNGWVTLEGSVAWEYQRTKARILTEDTSGVTGTTNLITISSDQNNLEIPSKNSTESKRNKHELKNETN